MQNLGGKQSELWAIGNRELIGKTSRTQTSQHKACTTLHALVQYHCTVACNPAITVLVMSTEVVLRAIVKGYHLCHHVSK